MSFSYLFGAMLVASLYPLLQNVLMAEILICWNKDSAVSVA